MNVSVNIRQHFFPSKNLREELFSPPPKKSYFGLNCEAIFNK